MAKITEGYMPYLGYQTYYRIVGERKDNGKAPLICLHGGPGSRRTSGALEPKSMVG